MPRTRHLLGLIGTLGILVTTVCTPSYGAEPGKLEIKSQDQLISAIKEAFQHKDADMLLSLQCFEGAEEGDVRAVSDYLTTTVKQESRVTSVDWLPLKGNESKLSSRGGRTYKYNLTPVGRVKISFESQDPTDDKAVTYTVGSKGDELRLSMKVPVGP